MSSGIHFFLEKRDAFIHKYALLRFLFVTQKNEVVIIQWPNLPLTVAIILFLVRLSVVQANVAHISLAYALTLIVWGIWESTSGVNPFRRLLGLTVIIVEIMGHFHR